LLALALCALAIPAPARTQETASVAAESTDQIIVRYRTDTIALQSAEDQAATLSAAAGVELAYARPASGELHVLALPAPLPLAEAEAVAARIANDPAVEYAVPDLPIFIARTPNDALFSQQWHYGPASPRWGVNLAEAWDITTGDPNLTIAIIDTGVRPEHPDLAGRSTPGIGYDLISSARTAADGGGRDPDPTDPGDWNNSGECSSGGGARNSSWHGTHVAGTIGAASNNSVGVTGVNWRSQMLHVRVLGKCGGTTSDLIDAIRWSAGIAVPGVPANPTPARVINMSLGSVSGLSCDAATQSAINDAVAQGAVVVVAAGNQGSTVAPPANCTGVIAVAASGPTGQRASYSNFGSEVDLTAPGGSGSDSVLSTINTGAQGPGANEYGPKQGTSMATPHVAGVASLLLSVDPSLTPAQVEAILRASVTPFAAGSNCTTNTCGAGILNAGQAVRAVAITPTITSLTPPSGIVGVSYSHTFTVTGRPAPELSLSAGGLPPGLTLDPVSGRLRGTPTAAGSYSFTVRAANGMGTGATQPVTLRINQTLGFTSQLPPGASVGQAYSHRFTASGTPAPTFRVATGQLPPGLSLNATTGVLAGTPTGTGGTFDLTFEATNGTETALQPVSLLVGAVPAFTSSTLPSGQIGVAYRHRFAASGTPAPTFTLSEGTLPAGLTLSASSGELSGTPTTAGVFTFTVRAANGVGSGATQRVSLTVRTSSGDIPRGFLPFVSGR
jgi:serine protease